LINFCSLKQTEGTQLPIHYEAGSIETLIQLVDKNDGITILPQLATERLTASQKKKLREFLPPKPVREISIVTVTHFPRKRILQHLKEEIISSVKQSVATKNRGLRVIDMDL